MGLTVGVGRDGARSRHEGDPSSQSKEDYRGPCEGRDVRPANHPHHEESDQDTYHRALRVTRPEVCIERCFRKRAETAAAREHEKLRSSVPQQVWMGVEREQQVPAWMRRLATLKEPPVYFESRAPTTCAGIKHGGGSNRTD